MRLNLKNIYFNDLLIENTNIIKREKYSILERKSTNAGDEYEQQIRDLLLKTRLAGPIGKSNKNPRNRWAPDADINLYGELLNVEIKAQANALFGSLSARFDLEKGFTGFTTDAAVLDPEFYDIMANAVRENENEVKELIKFIVSKDKYAEPKFPMVMRKSLYDKYSSKITKTYFTGKIPISVIHDLYASKNVYYMQIGNRGLYSLKKNYNFMPKDIPQLVGEIEFQIRPKPGSGFRGGVKTAKITMSVDFKFNIPSSLKNSPYSIDSEEGIKNLLSKIKNQTKKSNI